MLFYEIKTEIKVENVKKKKKKSWRISNARIVPTASLVCGETVLLRGTEAVDVGSQY